MEELVEYIAKALVEDAEAVEVSATDDVVELRVGAEDRGRVIGKNGRTAHAIRTLMAAAAQNGEPSTLDILD